MDDIEYLEKLSEELKQYNPIINHKYKYLSMLKKNVAKIEIHRSYFVNLSGHSEKILVKPFFKTKYGGYKQDTIRYCEVIEQVKQIIEQYFSLPEVKKTEDRPKDDKEGMLQNILTRELQRQCKEQDHYVHLTSLAKNENDVTQMNLRDIQISIGPKYIQVGWPTLLGGRNSVMHIEASSPNFDPDLIIKSLIKFDDKIRAEYDRTLKFDESLLEDVKGSVVNAATY